MAAEPYPWSHLSNLKLADPEYYRPGSIDIILGADVFGRIIQDGIIKRPPEDSPIAQKTTLGWILSEPTKINETLSDVHGCCSSFHVLREEDLYNLLRQFWTLEEFYSRKKSSLSLEEQE